MSQRGRLLNLVEMISSALSPRESNPVQQNYYRPWDLQGNGSILLCFSFIFKSEQSCPSFLKPPG